MNLILSEISVQAYDTLRVLPVKQLQGLLFSIPGTGYTGGDGVRKRFPFHQIAARAKDEYHPHKFVIL